MLLRNETRTTIATTTITTLTTISSITPAFMSQQTVNRIKSISSRNLTHWIFSINIPLLPSLSLTPACEHINVAMPFEISHFPSVFEPKFRQFPNILKYKINYLCYTSSHDILNKICSRRENKRIAWKWTQRVITKKKLSEKKPLFVINEFSF